VHLPNVIDFNLVYQLIEAEWEQIRKSALELVSQITALCQQTASVLLKKYFSRFSGLLELLEERAKEELQAVQTQTEAELSEMI